MNNVYEIRELCKTYKQGKVVANEGITFDVREGEILGVLGPNGAGKSTLVKQLIGHTPPTSGRICLFGRDAIKEAHWIPEVVSYFAQQPGALGSLTPQEAIRYTGRLRGLGEVEAKRQTTQLIERLEIGSFLNRRIRKLSGGQKRLVSMGALLIGHLPVLVLDEPTNELDPANRKVIWSALKERNEQQGTTILLVTHNVLEAEQVVDRVGIIAEGRLLALDSVAALKQKLDARLNLDVIARFGELPRAEEGLMQLGPVTMAGGHRLRLKLHPEQISGALGTVLEHQQAWAIDEFQVIPPTLEDVYFELGGKGGFAS